MPQIIWEPITAVTGLNVAQSNACVTPSQGGIWKEPSGVYTVKKFFQVRVGPNYYLSNYDSVSDERFY